MGIKEIVKITLFGVVGFVLQMVGAAVVALFGFYAVFVHTSVGAVLTGSIFTVMCHKVHKRGAAVIYYLISGIVYLVMGMWPMLIVMLAAGLLAEIILLGNEGYGNSKRIGTAFVVGELIYSLHGFFFIVFMGVNGLVKQFPKMFTVERAKGIADIFLNPRNLCIIISIQIIGGVVGAIFGNYIYKKFFSGKEKREKILS